MYLPFQEILIRVGAQGGSFPQISHQVTEGKFRSRCSKAPENRDGFSCRGEPAQASLVNVSLSGTHDEIVLRAFFYLEANL
jgi:hypothetical protein